MEQGLVKLLAKLGEYQEYIVWSFAFGLIHTLLSPRNRSVIAYLVAFCTSIPIGTLAGLWAQSAELSTGNVFVIVAVSALLAQDIIKLILKMSGFIQESSPTVFQAILDAILEKIKRL